MLKVSNLSKSFGGRSVLAGVSFVVNDGEVAGLVGPNGAGKTTLLNIIAGALAADSGSAVTTGALGYLRQGQATVASRAAAEVFPRAFALDRRSARLEKLAAALGRASASEYDAVAREYDRAVQEEAVGQPITLASAWQDLALRPIAPDERVGTLSGGEQTKLGLLDVLASRPEVLLLDEPTNNLDLPSLEWLDAFLDKFHGPVLIVSHDRALLDDHATQILDLDARTGGIAFYAGHYTAYAEEKARREAELWARYRRQQEREQQLEREIRSIGDTARRRERISQNDYYRGRNKKFARRGVMLRRRLERETAADGHLDRPQTREYRVKADLAPSARGGDRMLFAEAITLEAGGRTLLHRVSLTIAWGERVVLTGANGSGKTTLLRALAGAHQPYAGRTGASPSAVIGYLPQGEAIDVRSGATPVDTTPVDTAPMDTTPVDTTPVDVIRAASTLSETEARRFLHRFLFSGDGALTPVDRLSYGERRRLSLATLVLGGANILLLDEPTNHRDIPSREAFEQALDSYAGAMLAVTHDRYFIERFADRILRLEGGRLIE